MMNKPIPAFYCCYLLRSVPVRTAFYIGSTPNPKRRLAQHNGTTKGGAKQTSRNSRQPWHVSSARAGACVEAKLLQGNGLSRHGIPFKDCCATVRVHPTALGYDTLLTWHRWAWQHPNTTRHIPGHLRPHEVIMRRTRTGKQVPSLRPKQLQLNDSMESLHLLLRSPSFERWPLAVRFFDADIFNVWTRHGRDRPDLAPGVEVRLDDQAKNTNGRSGAEEIDPTYKPMLTELELSKSLFEVDELQACSLCEKQVSTSRDLLLRCPSDDCRVIQHLICLSDRWKADAALRDKVLAPIRGKCPACETDLRWDDLVKDLSLRLRGQAVLDALFKRRLGTRAIKGGVDEGESLQEETLLGGLVDERHEEPEVNFDPDYEENGEAEHEQSSYIDLEVLLQDHASRMSESSTLEYLDVDAILEKHQHELAELYHTHVILQELPETLYGKDDAAKSTTGWHIHCDPDEHAKTSKSMKQRGKDVDNDSWMFESPNDKHTSIQNARCTPSQRRMSGKENVPAVPKGSSRADAMLISSSSP